MSRTLTWRYSPGVSSLNDGHDDPDEEEHLSLLHTREPESDVGQEREGELQAGVEKQVEEVNQAMGLEGSVVRGRQIFERSKSDGMQKQNKRLDFTAFIALTRTLEIY